MAAASIGHAISDITVFVTSCFIFFSVFAPKMGAFRVREILFGAGLKSGPLEGYAKRCVLFPKRVHLSEQDTS